MPNPSFIISGTITDLEDNGITGVTIAYHNLTQVEDLFDTSTAGGEHSKNLQLYTTLSNGDVIEVIANATGFEQSSQTVTYTGQDAEIVNLIMYPRLPRNLDIIKIQEVSHLEGMSAYGRAFFKFFKNYSLTTSFVEQGGEKSVLDIPSGYVAFITDLYVMSDGNTDDIFVQLRKNSDVGGAGISKDIFPEFISAGPLVKPPYQFRLPLRVKYDSNQAKSIVMAIKGSGTSDNVNVAFRGYLIREAVAQ